MAKDLKRIEELEKNLVSAKEEYEGASIKLGDANRNLKEVDKRVKNIEKLLLGEYRK